MPLPGMWQARGMAFNGAVWFRRTIDVPESWAGRSLRLDLGAIDDFDTTYFNGTAIGATGIDVPDAWRTQRRYTVPAALVRAGKNLIAVRVFDRGGDGGFAGPVAAMRIHPEGRAAEAIPLAGKWRVVVERSIPLPPRENSRPGEMAAHEYPSALFNGMIAPLVRVPIRGVLWYQGESDVDRAHLYRAIFSNLIMAWRAAWGIGDFPFLFVQLANWLARKTEPADDAWAELREAQALALRLPATGMVVAADVGDEADIHPREKRTVGERLALAALAIAYARAMPYSGPIYAGHAVEQGAMRIRFNHAEAGLRVRGGGALAGFAIAGADRNFRWATEARIDGATVVVRHADIAAPVAVRYAWEANPLLTLENGVGLPAAPFRTDDWPGITTGKF
jgi:sialate O-acetylesterase